MILEVEADGLLLRSRAELAAFLDFLRNWLNRENSKSLIQTIKNACPTEPEPDLSFPWIANGEIFRLGEITFSEATLQEFISALQAIHDKWDELTNDLAAADAEDS